MAFKCQVILKESVGNFGGENRTEMILGSSTFDAFKLLTLFHYLLHEGSVQQRDSYLTMNIPILDEMLLYGFVRCYSWGKLDKKYETSIISYNCM